MKITREKIDLEKAAEWFDELMPKREPEPPPDNRTFEERLRDEGDEIPF